MSFKPEKEMREEIRKVIRLVGGQEVVAKYTRMSVKTLQRRLVNPYAMTFREAQKLVDLAGAFGVEVRFETTDKA